MTTASDEPRGLTCSIEAIAATAAGVYTVLVDRPGNAALSHEARQQFPVIQQLTDLP
jgi:enolase-phosphatase E1